MLLLLYARRAIDIRDSFVHQHVPTVLVACAVEERFQLLVVHRLPDGEYVPPHRVVVGETVGLPLVSVAAGDEVAERQARVTATVQTTGAGGVYHPAVRLALTAPFARLQCRDISGFVDFGWLLGTVATICVLHGGDTWGITNARFGMFG